MKDLLAAASLVGAFIFGNVWFWGLHAWAEVLCVVCIGIMSYSIAFVKN